MDEEQNGPGGTPSPAPPQWFDANSTEGEQPPVSHESFLGHLGNALSRGVTGAVNEASNDVWGASEYISKVSQAYKLGRNAQQQKQFLNEEAKPASQTNPFQLDSDRLAPGATDEHGVWGGVQQVVQFGVGAAMASKVLKVQGITGALTKIPKVGAAAATVAKGFTTGFAFMGPLQQRLSNLVEAHPALSNPITRFLAEKDSDPELLSRIKAGLEFGVTDAMAESVIGGLKLFKAGKLAQAGKIPVEDVAKVADEAKAAPHSEPAMPQVATVEHAEDGTAQIHLTSGEEGAAAQEPLHYEDPAQAEAHAASINTYANDLRLSGKTISTETMDRWRDVYRLHANALETADLGPKLYGTDMTFVQPEKEAVSAIQAMSVARSEALTEVANRTRDGLGQSWDDSREALQQIFGGMTTADNVTLRMQKLFGDMKDTTSLVQASKDYMTSFGSKMSALAEAVDKDPMDHAAYANLLDHGDKMSKLYEAFTGVKAELGRGLQVLQEEGQGAPGVLSDGKLPEPNVGPTEGLKSGVLMSNLLNRPGSIWDGLTPKEVMATARMFRFAKGDPNVMINIMRGNRALTDKALTEQPGFWRRFLGARLNNLLSPASTVSAVTSHILTTLQVPSELFFTGLGRGLTTGDFSAARQGIDQFKGIGLALRMKDVWSATSKALLAGEHTLDPGRYVWENGQANHDPNLFGYIGDKFGLTGPARGMLDWMDKFEKIPNRMLMANTEFFKQLNYRAELQSESLRLARQDGLTGPAVADRMASDMEAAFDPNGGALNPKALQAARVATFQNDLHGFMSDVQQFAQKYPAVQFILPFIRTPTNILRWNVQRTPALGFISQEMREDLAAGGERRMNALAKQSMGASVMTTGYMLASQGVITGAGPQNPDLRKSWSKNNQPYSIQIGGKQISYRRLEPIATPLMLMADMASVAGAVKHNEDGLQVTGAILTGLMHAVTDHTFLQGVSDFFDAVSKGEWAKLIQDDLAPVVAPNMVKNAVPDQAFREARGLLDHVWERVPGMSSTLEPERNLFGEVVMRPPYVQSLYNPFTVMDAPSDKDAYQQIVQLGRAIPMPKTHIGPNDTIDLTDRNAFDNGTHQSPYDRVLELVGKPKDGRSNLRDDMNALINSDRWKTANPGNDLVPGGRRFELANALVQEHINRANREMMQEYPKLQAAQRAYNQQKSAAVRSTGSVGADQDLLNP